MTSTGLQIYASKWLFPTSKSYYVHLWDVPSTNVPPISWWPIPQVLLQVFLTKGKSKMIQFQLSEVTFSFKLNHRKKAACWNKFSPKPGPPPPKTRQFSQKYQKIWTPPKPFWPKVIVEPCINHQGIGHGGALISILRGWRNGIPPEKKTGDEWHHNCNWLFCLSNGIHLCLCRNSCFFLCRYIFGSEIKEWGPFSGIILGIPNEKRFLPSDAPVPSISSTTRLFNVNVCLWKSIALQGII